MVAVFSIYNEFTNCRYEDANSMSIQREVIDSSVSDNWKAQLKQSFSHFKHLMKRNFQKNKINWILLPVVRILLEISMSDSSGLDQVMSNLISLSLYYGFRVFLLCILNYRCDRISRTSPMEYKIDDYTEFVIGNIVFMIEIAYFGFPEIYGCKIQ